MRRFSTSWNSTLARLGFKKTSGSGQSLKSRRGHSYGRKLRAEPLEDRRMLAGVTVNSLDDVVNGDTDNITDLIATPGVDGITLREAIIAANNTSGADTITITATGTITLSSALPTITDDLTIQGPGKDDLIIDAIDSYRIFAIRQTAVIPADNYSFDDLKSVAISGMELTNAYWVSNGGFGGAIYSSENLSIDDVRFSSNYAYFGGGILSDRGNVTVTRSEFSENWNHAIGMYGAIDLITGFYPTLKVTDSEFTLNESEGSGTISSSEIDSGGAAIEVHNSTFTENSAATSGGAIWQKGIPLIINGCTFEDNSSVLDGGAVYHDGGSIYTQLIVENNTVFESNTAGRDGGAIWIHTGTEGTTARLSNIVAYGNTALYGKGGAAFVTTTNGTGVGGNVEIFDSTFGHVDGDEEEGKRNVAEFGGAIYLDAFGFLNSQTRLNGLVIINNSASLNGGGLFVHALSSDNLSWLGVQVESEGLIL